MHIHVIEGFEYDPIIYYYYYLLQVLLVVIRLNY